MGWKNIQAAAYNDARTVIENTPAFLIELFSFLHGMKKLYVTNKPKITLI
jgi:hypothetical protein